MSAEVVTLAEHAEIPHVAECMVLSVHAHVDGLAHGRRVTQFEKCARGACGACCMRLLRVCIREVRFAVNVCRASGTAPGRSVPPVTPPIPQTTACVRMP